MKRNVGTLDRLFRAVLGLVLLWLALFSTVPAFQDGALKYGVAAIGIVMLAVSMLRNCPIYTVLGIRTCRTS